MSTGYWLGVDLGGTKILAGLFDDDLKLLARSKQPTAAESGPTGVFANIVKAVDAVVREANVDLAQVRAHEDVARFGDDRHAHVRRHVVQPR